MGAKLEKISAELEKARAKRAALDVKIKNLEQKYQEEENTEIHDMVHAANLTPDQLAESAPYGSEGCTESADAHGNSEGG